MVTTEQLAELLKAGKQWVPHDLFTDANGLAFFLDTTTRTLANWREAGQGPAWAQMGNRIVYDLNDVSSWWNRNFHGKSMKNDEIKGNRDMDSARLGG